MPVKVHVHWEEDAADTSVCKFQLGLATSQETYPQGRLLVPSTFCCNPVIRLCGTGIK